MMIAQASAPSWVTYLTLGIACVGLLTGLGSLAVSFVNYRMSGHRVSVTGPGILIGPGASQDHWSGGLIVRNEGRGPVSVDAVLVRAVGSASGKVLPGMGNGLAVFEERILHGARPVIRLEGNQSTAWTLNMSGICGDLMFFLLDAPREDRPYVQFGVLLGDGTRTWSKERFWGDKYLLDGDERGWSQKAEESAANLQTPLDDD